MAKFKYSMQNILDIKIKLETQAKNDFSAANQKYQIEKDKLQALVLKRVEYEDKLKESLAGKLSITDINITKKDINSIKSAIRTQLSNVKKAEDELEAKRLALNELMKDRKTHEKLREKKFEEFQKDERDSESKEIDELVSFTYNS
ncbi:flagellar export protein FliJ [Agathobacter sp.]